jgi:hypothetical protein
MHGACSPSTTSSWGIPKAALTMFCFSAVAVTWGRASTRGRREERGGGAGGMGVGYTTPDAFVSRFQISISLRQMGFQLCSFGGRLSLPHL